MEVPPFRELEAYTSNSVVHQIEDLNTPLLVTFGTEDDAVDFNQGIELYNAARRAEKPVVLVTYEGENHRITRRAANQIDEHERILSWLRHGLGRGEGPRWITEGIPYLRQQDAKKKLKAKLESGQNPR